MKTRRLCAVEVCFPCVSPEVNKRKEGLTWNSLDMYGGSGGTAVVGICSCSPLASC